MTDDSPTFDTDCHGNAEVVRATPFTYPGDDEDPESAHTKNRPQGELLARALRWLIGKHADLESIGFRTLAAAWVINPGLLDGASENEVARHYGKAPSGFCKYVGEFCKLIGFTLPKPTPKPKDENETEITKLRKKKRRLKPAKAQAAIQGQPEDYMNSEDHSVNDEVAI